MATPVSDMLTVRLAASPSAPFLFVGSGLSRRYADLETWDALLKRFAAPYLPKDYEYYRSKVNGDLARTAGAVADAFHEIWWSHADFDGSRKDLAGKAHPTRSFPLKYEISKYLQAVKLKSGATSDGVDRDREVELLKKATIDGIITTNWDAVLESIFPDYKIYVGQDSLLFSQAYFVAEIHKIHGSASEPASLVLTDDDYADFNAKNPYLAAKLLTVFIEHPVIFLGYSLSDPNITAILRSIAKALSPVALEKLRDRLIFVQRETNTSRVQSSFIDMGGGDKIPLTVAYAKDFCEVYEPLSVMKRRFPARLLRQMKEHVYDLVLKNDPGKKLYVIDINDADSFGEIDVVYGVGASERLGAKGYAGIGAMDLFKDVVTTNMDLEPKAVVAQTLPRLTPKHHHKYVPAFRYLRSCGLLNDDGSLRNPDKQDAKVREFAKREQSDYYAPQYYREKKEQVQKLGSVRAVVDHYGAEEASLYLSLLREDQIDVVELRSYIIANMGLLVSEKSVHRTYFGATIGLYDYLAYKRVRKSPVATTVPSTTTEKQASERQSKMAELVARLTRTKKPKGK